MDTCGHRSKFVLISGSTLHDSQLFENMESTSHGIRVNSVTSRAAGHAYGRAVIYVKVMKKVQRSGGLRRLRMSNF